MVCREDETSSSQRIHHARVNDANFGSQLDSGRILYTLQLNPAYRMNSELAYVLCINYLGGWMPSDKAILTV